MLTLAQLAEQLGGVWHGNANHAIFSFASLSRATSRDLAYYDNSLLQQSLLSSSAGAVLLSAEQLHLSPGNAIVVTNPLQAMMKAASLLESLQTPVTGVDPCAKIHPTAQLGKDISIGAYTVIGAEVQLADGVSIGANTVIESEVCIGKNSSIANGVVVHAGCQIGADVLVNSGCILGATPFNYVKQHGQWQQGPAAGGVIVADGVHLGANSVIDRGALGDTYLGAGVCVDNLVQIAHDVLIAKNSVIAGCAAIGAYAQIGADCIIGGASCIAAYVQLVDDVVITGMSTVNKSITKAGIYSSGTLVHKHQAWRRNAARYKRLNDYIVRLNNLEKKLADVE